MIVDSTINSNSAKASGGGIGNETGGTFTATNVTLAFNAAGSGGGIENAGTSTFVNSTIAYNTVKVAGGGVYVSAGTTSLYNTIVASNYLNVVSTASDIAVVAASGGKVGPTSAYNLIGSGGAGGLSGNGNQILAKGVSPGLANSLGANGGPTETLALLAGSPAIDKGSATIPGATIPVTDQRGALRGTAGLDAGLAPDVGAFEASSSYLVTTTSTRPDVGTIETAVGWANISTNVNPANPTADPVPNTIVFDASGSGIFDLSADDCARCSPRVRKQLRGSEGDQRRGHGRRNDQRRRRHGSDLDHGRRDIRLEWCDDRRRIGDRRRGHRQLRRSHRSTTRRSPGTKPRTAVPSTTNPAPRSPS